MIPVVLWTWSMVDCLSLKLYSVGIIFFTQYFHLNKRILVIIRYQLVQGLGNWDILLEGYF